MRRLLIACVAAVIAGLMVTVPASATVDHFKINQQIPFAGFQVDVPCTGDTITFTQGYLHDMFYLTVNRSHFTVTAHDQPHNLKGTDTSGRHYEAVGITRSHDSGSFVNGHAESSFVNNFYMIGKAGAPSYKIHESFHITFTPSGRLATVHDKLRTTCR
jgi:hypothetical protein